jgi:hypothetical protein
VVRRQALGVERLPSLGGLVPPVLDALVVRSAVPPLGPIDPSCL